jgi:hypothetical protein
MRRRESSRPRSCAKTPPAENTRHLRALSLLVAGHVDHWPGYHGAAMGTEAVRFLVLSPYAPGRDRRDGLFSVEVLTLRGLVRYLVLFVIDLQTRRVQIGAVVRRSYVRG